MAAAAFSCRYLPISAPIYTTLCFCVGWAGKHVVLETHLLNVCARCLGLSAAALGWNASYSDLSQRSAGMLMGVGNTLATLPTLISPHMTAIILTKTTLGWSGVFSILAGFNIFAAGFYFWYMQCKNLDDDDDEKED